MPAAPLAARRDMIEMTPARSERSRSASPNRRKKLACHYCFKRKIKCDLREPVCSNCEEHNKECVPSDRPSRARPTHGRIEQLEEEITHLKQHISRLESTAAQASSFQHVPAEVEQHVPDAPSLRPASVLQGIDDPADKSTPPWFRRSQAAHGPTSALFDDIDDQPLHDTNVSHNVPEAELRDKATAACSAERHKELLNLASNRLDFDGVAPDLAMDLLALHWNRQHFAFLISYRPLFTRDMACQGPYFSKLLLNAIFFSVSKFSNRPEVYDDPLDQTTAGQRFIRRIKELLGAALDQSSIPTIQAMLLLSSSLFALGHQSAAWLYSGIAIRMIFDLGLNYDVGATSTALLPEELEIRRRVVWACYISDKIISLYQGRSVSFSYDRMHVPHRFLDRYEELELWTPLSFQGNHHYPGAPARAVSTFTALCSLSVIMERIITDIYAEKGPHDRPGRHLERLAALLHRWRTALPREIDFDPISDQNVPPPHVLSLHSVYYTLVTLLHRPFVETAMRHFSPDLVQISWQRCEEAAKGATDILTRYRQTFSLAKAPYLISYTTYVAATIHVRMVAQRGPGSESARLLAVCLEGLSENSNTNPGVKKMYSMITRLMERLGVHLDATGSEMPTNMFNAELDLSAIIRSFAQDTATQSGSMPDFGSQAFMESPMDYLYGFLGLPQPQQ